MINKAKVCHLTTVHPASDARIFHKECKSLANAGYNVTLVSHGQKGKIVDKVTLVSLPETKSRLYRILIVNFKIFKIAFKERADLYHFHDPELIPIVILLKLLLQNTKIIYDVHEDYQEKILSKTWIKEWLRKQISIIFTIFEKFSSKLFDYIVTADSHVKKKFASRKTESIANFPPLSFANNLKTECTNTPFKMIYSGRISKDRGIHIIIDALRYLNKDVFELHLLGRIDDDKLLELLYSKENIKYHGELPWQDVNKYLIEAHVGLILLQPVPAYLYYTGENITKLFEYMATGLPVIISDFPKLKRLITEFRCGFAINPSDPKNIAAVIEYLHSNPSLRKAMGQRGRTLVFEKYNWENECKKLLSIYADVLK